MKKSKWQRGDGRWQRARSAGEVALQMIGFGLVLGAWWVFWVALK